MKHITLSHHAVPASQTVWFVRMLAILMLALAFLVSVPKYTHAQTVPTVSLPCHTITTTSDPIPSKYGSPIGFFGLYPTPLIKVFCNSPASVRVSLGDGADTTYIYKYGYHTVGGKRTRVTLAGENEVAGAWVVGLAEVELPTADAQKGSVYAYVCQQVEGVWKCGCKDTVCAVPYWQVQTYQRAPQSSSVDFFSSNEYLETVIPGITKYLEQTGTTVEALEKEAYKKFATIVTDTFEVFSVAPLVVSPGSTARLTAQHASKSAEGNTVTWFSVSEKKEVYVARNVTSSDGHVLTLTVPALPAGKYTLRVTNDEGVRAKGEAVVWIAGTASQKPSISHISPTAGVQGGKFTLHGSNFSLVGNDISTTYGLLENVASPDGTTLTFTYDPFDETVQFRNLEGEPITIAQKIHVSVLNEGGESAQDGTTFFTLNIN
jgi:hypothetical protein